MGIRRASVAFKPETKEKIRSFWAYHIDTVRMAVLAIPRWVWVLPFVLFGAILLVVQTPVVWALDKPVQEIVAPVIIGLAALASLATHYWVRHTFSLMVALFACSLFLREWHVFGTDPGIYWVMMALLWWASARREHIAHFAGDYATRAAFGAGVWTYIIADLSDRHIFGWLPNYMSWHDYVEETLESLGHLFVFAFVIAVLRFGSTRVGESRRRAQKVN